ncbi:hypothetical protein LshimejAT787_0701710 [Lyophyllum shimeji]|uniref:Uncharacterized protein n=1 Tax=Lyophyllum shimeji TaxID=47721 RepID=A0A9P3PQS3_LYOSH|nr:hypothetical protein LshimejAT787_0701710 [Lyophyllum shimeji]
MVLKPVAANQRIRTPRLRSVDLGPTWDSKSNLKIPSEFQLRFTRSVVSFSTSKWATCLGSEDVIQLSFIAECEREPNASLTLTLTVPESEGRGARGESLAEPEDHGTNGAPGRAFKYEEA